MLKRWMVAGLMAIALAHAVPAAAQVQGQSPYFGWTRLVNAEWTERKGPTGGQCIDVPHANRTVGTVTQMFRCHAALKENQAFALLDQRFDNSRIAVFSGNDQRCLAVEDRGWKVNLAHCATAPRWTTTDQGQIRTADLRYCIKIPDNGYLELTTNCTPGGLPDPRTVFGSNWHMSRLLLPDGNIFAMFNVGHTKCLDVAGGSMAPGASLVHYRCHFEGNQRFKIFGNAAGRRFLAIYDNGFLLCVSNVLDGEWTQAVPCNPWDEGQMWEWEVKDPTAPISLGLMLRNVKTLRCLDAMAKKNSPTGTWPCHGGSNQKWTPIEF